MLIHVGCAVLQPMAGRHLGMSAEVFQVHTPWTTSSLVPPGRAVLIHSLSTAPSIGCGHGAQVVPSLSPGCPDVLPQGCLKRRARALNMTARAGQHKELTLSSAEVPMAQPPDGRLPSWITSIVSGA